MPVVDAAALAAAVRARRAELGLAQKDLAARGGPSVVTVRQVEQARLPRCRDLTLSAFDRALRWVPGSAARVGQGGAPQPLPEDGARRVPALLGQPRTVFPVLRSLPVPPVGPGAPTTGATTAAVATATTAAASPAPAAPGGVAPEPSRQPVTAPLPGAAHRDDVATSIRRDPRLSPEAKAFLLASYELMLRTGGAAAPADA